VSQIKIYIDEDAMDSDLVAALRSRDVTVVTALDAGLTEKPDEEQLAFATERARVLTRSTCSPTSCSPGTCSSPVVW